MTIAQAPEPVRRSGIGRLIEDLRRDGFPVSTSEAIDAARLLLFLAEHEPDAAQDPGQLCARLRPVFCKTPEQQERFDAIFGAWFQVGERPVIVDPPPPPPPPPQRKPRWLVWGALGLVVVLGVIAFVVFNRPGPIDPGTTATSTAVAVADTAGTTGVTDTTTSPPSERPRVLGYFPRLRYNRELRPMWVGLFAALPLMTLAAFSVPAWVIARTRARRRSEPMFLDRGELEKDARRIVPPLRPDIVGKLARHLRGSPDGAARLTRRPILDVRATIEKTLRNRGIPSPQYRHTYAPPSYLLLVDIANQKDPRGRLFYQWAERLQRERLEVEIALVRLQDDEPQFVPTERGVPRRDRAWMPLARLPEPPFGQRLLLVSTGEILVDGKRWRDGALAARLHRWRQRAMFTPIEPRDWGPREDKIERPEHTADPGFLVLPLEENALSAWTDLLTTGQLSDIVLAEPQRFPGMLRGGKGSDLLEHETAPSHERLERLIGQLRIYLGELGFQWLAALAIAPLVRWELAVLIGREVIGRHPAQVDPKRADAVLVRHYRRLTRLPWLQLEKMPDWLRLRLLAELPATTQNHLRDVVKKLLGRLDRKDDDGDGIELGFEQPPDQEPKGGSPAPDRKADALYIGYMSGLTPHQLAMTVPDEWAKWLPQVRLPRERGFRGFLATSADYARTWWVRRVFAGGLPFSRMRRWPLLWAIAIVLVGAAFLRLAATKDRQWWPESLEERLFEEQVHAVAFHHAGPVRTASFSPDGLRVVTASDDGTARVWDVKSGKAVSPPLKHDGPVIDAQFSPYGNVVVTASGNRWRRWDVETGAGDSVGTPHLGEIRHVRVNAGGSRVMSVGGSHAMMGEENPLLGGGAVRAQHDVINDAAFTYDGGFVTVGQDGTAKIWSEDGKLTFTLRHDGPVRHASSNRARPLVVTASADLTARVWDSDKGTEIARFQHDAQVLHAEFNREGTEVVTTAIGGTARVWDIASRVQKLSLRHPGVFSASFSSDGQRILTAGADSTARVWDATTGSAIGPELRHEQPLSSASFNAEGTRIVTAAFDGTTKIWEAIADEPEIKPLRHSDTVYSVSFDPADRRVVTGSFDGSAKVWDASTGAQITPTFQHADKVWSVEFSPDGQNVVTSSSDGTVGIWDSRTGKRAPLPLRENAMTFHATYSPDGFRILASMDEIGARLFDARTGTPLGPPIGAGIAMPDARFSPDGRWVVNATFSGAAHIWDTATGKAVGGPFEHKEGVRHATFSPDGRLVVTTGGDGTAKIWDPPTSVLIAELKHENRLQMATFDPKSRYVVTASDGSARIWDARNGRRLHVLGHDGLVTRAFFSPDGRQVVSASLDGTVRLWSTATGLLVGPPMRHRSAVRSVAFSVDGKRLISGGTPAVGADAANVPLPGEYAAPASSAQIWRIPPFPPPDTSSKAESLRHRAGRALERATNGIVVSLVAGVLAVLLLPPLIVALRRRRHIVQLATTREGQR